MFASEVVCLQWLRQGIKYDYEFNTVQRIVQATKYLNNTILRFSFALRKVSLKKKDQRPRSVVQSRRYGMHARLRQVRSSASGTVANAAVSLPLSLINEGSKVQRLMTYTVREGLLEIPILLVLWFVAPMSAKRHEGCQLTF